MSNKMNSRIKLGEKYQESRHLIVGHAVAIFFNENGCVEVVLENVHEGKTQTHYFPQQRLQFVGNNEPVSSTYETDIEFGKEYVDTQTGVKGWAAVLEFHEFIANRISLRSKGEDREGNAKLIYHSIDDFLLSPVEGGRKARRKDDKPSPVARQVERR